MDSKIQEKIFFTFVKTSFSIDYGIHFFWLSILLKSAIFLVACSKTILSSWFTLVHFPLETSLSSKFDLLFCDLELCVLNFVYLNVVMSSVFPNVMSSFLVESV